MNAPDKNRAQKTRRRLVALVVPQLAVALALGLAGCDGRNANTPAARASADYFGDVSPPKGQVFTFNNGAEPEHLDPAIMSGQPDGRIARLVFEGLCSSDPQTLAPIPGLAARWDLSPDRTVYTFHLRPNLVWADGHPLTASDFVSNGGT